MVTKVHRWGNSLGLRISKTLAEDAHISDGTAVDMKVEKGRLVVVPLRSQTYALEDLLSGVKAGNLHDEVSTGGPQGGEAW